jgi:multidrug efflux pump subunit AcrA (membrane-fusion protein)
VKSILRFVAGLAILAVGIFVMKGLVGMKTEPPVKSRPVTARPVKATEVVLVANQPHTPIEGRVDALYRMSLFAEVNGVLAIGGKEFREGTRFRRGEVILRMDDREPRSALVAQRSQFLQSLSVALADLRVDFPEAWSAWMDYVESFDVTKAMAPLPEPRDQRERLFLANRGILSSYHNIRSAEERLAKFQVVAPFDGVMTEAFVQPGGLVRAGQPMGTFVGDGAFEVKSAVHARYLPVLAAGDSVAFFEESGIQVAVGQVNRIASNVDPATQSASVFCGIRAVESDQLRDGRYLSGAIVSTPILESFALRVDLISPSNTLFVVSEENDEQVLRERKVEVLFRSQEIAIVRGLADGFRVLAEPMNGTYDGMPVNIVE